MENGKDFGVVFNSLFKTDEEFEEYIHIKCNQALSENPEYLDKENSGLYDEDELSIMRDVLVFKKAYSCAFTHLLQIMSWK